MAKKVTTKEVDALKKYVRATNYLAVSQIYLKENTLLKRPLVFDDIKPRLLGHWGTCPGINFVYAQVNRLIVKNNAKFLYVVGPGHGFPAMQANLFVEKSLTNYYPKRIPYSEKGIVEICSKFSAPYGYPSHSNPAAPGAILEGGELGYSLSVSYGSILDNPDLITVCLVGDGESETGPIAAAWHANKLVNPAENGAVLQVLHLNGYKISGPTIPGRMDDNELRKLYEGYGYEPHFVDESKSGDVYRKMAETMDECYAKIRDIQKKARTKNGILKPKWPMIVMRTPKGWTGIKYDGKTKLEGNCKSHQVIIGDVKKNKEHLKMLEKWMKSYKFHELFDDKKNDFIPEIKSLIPKKGMACGSQKHAFGGEVMKELKYPKLSDLAISVRKRGNVRSSSMALAGKYFEQIFKLNKKNNNFRIFSPDETYSNKIDAVFSQTSRCWQWPIEKFDTDLKPQGKVMEMLSEHTLFGMLHGYGVTGRHGVFVSYEAFVQVVASMADQYVKFIKASEEVNFRKPLPALNVILTSLLERQDHNGFSHQNPSFISSMMEKDGNIIKTYLPPDANSMLVTMEECFRDRDSLNVIVAAKKKNYDWLTLKEAKHQMGHGIMTWDFASDKNPHVVIAGCGDYVTNECLAAIQIVKEMLPKVRLRFVCVSELTALGVGDETVKSSSPMLDEYFTKDKRVIYNFHGYPQTIKKLLFDYTGCNRIKVNGYLEEGSTTTPFDMEARNKTSRYHLVLDIIDALLSEKVINKHDHDWVKKETVSDLNNHRDYILEYGDDPYAISNWKWS
ncbi:phosphoketolase family protein [Candidatus Peregrinibacteria bacterium]|nr:phosphoketolase family protein [Candidatus Peregrinibacteria bacterium]